MTNCLHPLILSESSRVGPGGYILTMRCQYCGYSYEETTEYQNPGGPWYRDPVDEEW